MMMFAFFYRGAPRSGAGEEQCTSGSYECNGIVTCETTGGGFISSVRYTGAVSLRCGAHNRLPGPHIHIQQRALYLSTAAANTRSSLCRNLQLIVHESAAALFPPYARMRLFPPSAGARRLNASAASQHAQITFHSLIYQMTFRFAKVPMNPEQAPGQQFVTQ